MSSLRKLKALVLGHTVEVERTAAELQAASVPVSDADCRDCADPCDIGHEEYAKEFDVDMETQMLGSVKPYRRQVVISTGQTDWPKEVTDVPGSLAAYLNAVSREAPRVHHAHKTPGSTEKDVPGIFEAAGQSRISILNGSHRRVSNDYIKETVLVLPDYKIINNVEPTMEGAQKLWSSAMDPSLGRAASATGDKGLRTWVLPYSCVILLCSHKRRDNRCAIAAPALEHGFTHALEREGWEAHTQLDEPPNTDAPLEEFDGTDEEREAEVLRRLKAVDPHHCEHKRALILCNSHIGGHKFAGNVIIYTPQGVSVWYGRVTPHEVDNIVKETIIGGKVLPALLRGGMNLTRPPNGVLYDW